MSCDPDRHILVPPLAFRHQDIRWHTMIQTHRPMHLGLIHCNGTGREEGSLRPSIRPPPVTQSSSVICHACTRIISARASSYVHTQLSNNQTSPPRFLGEQANKTNDPICISIMPNCNLVRPGEGPVTTPTHGQLVQGVLTHLMPPLPPDR